MDKEEKPKVKRAVLHFVNDSEKYNSVKLNHGATIIGREKGDIIIDDLEVSSTHCQIQYVDQSYFILDMNSTNGTFVNAKKILRHKLESDDRISIGGTFILFILEDEDKVKKIQTLAQVKISSPPKSSSDRIEKTNIISLFRDAQSRKKVWLMLVQVRYGDGQEETLQFTQSSLYLGRNCEQGKFQLDENLSRRHLLVKINESGEIFAEDLGSTNGSFLNKKKMDPGVHKIMPSDSIEIGSCTLQVLSIEKEES
ncbi:MAG: FHA domain-containing protein [Oligoflexales bacterium]|nr:FHA domain-containing protein [Oligoflexales bacterium]